MIVHDELDFEPGRMQVKLGGGLAGHNGLRSITAHLHTSDFARIRIGVGKPPGGKERGADHVLSAPSKRDRELIDVCVDECGRRRRDDRRARDSRRPWVATTVDDRIR